MQKYEIPNLLTCCLKRSLQMVQLRRTDGPDVDFEGVDREAVGDVLAVNAGEGGDGDGSRDQSFWFGFEAAGQKARVDRPTGVASLVERERSFVVGEADVEVEVSCATVRFGFMAVFRG